MQTQKGSPGALQGPLGVQEAPGTARGLDSTEPVICAWTRRHSHGSLAVPGSPGEAAEEADGPACVLKGGQGTVTGAGESKGRWGHKGHG